MTLGNWTKSSALAALAAGLALAAIPAAAYAEPGEGQHGHWDNRGGGGDGGFQRRGGDGGGQRPPVAAPPPMARPAPMPGPQAQGFPPMARPAPMPAPQAQGLPPMARGWNGGRPGEGQPNGGYGRPDGGWQGRPQGQQQGQAQLPPRNPGYVDPGRNRGYVANGGGQGGGERGRNDGPGWRDGGNGWRGNGGSSQGGAERWRNDGNGWRNSGNGWRGNGGDRNRGDWNGRPQQGWNGQNWNRGGDRRWDHDGDHRWDRDWRRDNRYNWSYWRDNHRDQFHVGRYNPPYRDWNYRRLSIGFFLDNGFYGSDYLIDDPWAYRLPPAYGPYRWVRYYDDALLVDIYTGEVVDTIYDFFW